MVSDSAEFRVPVTKDECRSGKGWTSRITTYLARFRVDSSSFNNLI
jgi:hypothetical protein